MGDLDLWRRVRFIAERHPARPALRDHHDARLRSIGGVLSYRQLVESAAGLADELRRLDVRPGSVVPVHAPSGAGLAIGALAVLAVGAAYLPLDPALPAGRRSDLLVAARPAAVLDWDGGLPSLGADGDVVAVVRPRWPLVTGDPDDFEPPAAPDDPAYVVYTSGSTGRPKGVVIASRGMAALLADLDRLAPVPEAAAHAWWASPGFDVSVYEMWSALAGAGCLIPLPPTLRLDAGASLDRLTAEQVASAYLPRQFLPLLRDRARGDVASVPRLRRLLVGVEPIPLGLLQDIQEAIPGCQVINGYGPTETTVCATLYRVPAERGDHRARAPIGFAVTGNRLFILDEGGRPVRPGEAGELYVAGQNVALEYLHARAETAERFVRAADGDGVMYRTGDLVRADGSGALTFLGRNDDQVKISGVRVEPAEAEAALCEHPVVRDAAVIARAGLLTAYVVPRAGISVEWSAVLADIAHVLPAAMLPRRIVELDAIAYTPDGKLDRAALDRLDAAAPAPEPAGSVTETIVAAACAAELDGSATVSMVRSLAELGGDSLKATAVAARLRSALAVEVTGAQVLAAASLADLARQVAQGRPVVAADRRDGVQGAPLTAGMVGIWAADLAGAAPGTFSEAVALELIGPYAAEEVAEALRRVLARHPVFLSRIDPARARLIAIAGDPLVRVAESRTAPDPEAHWSGLVRDAHATPFDLRTGPFVRATVTAWPGGVRLICVWHHIVVDGATVRIVLGELRDVLRGHGLKPYPDTGYGYFADRERAFLASPAGRATVTELAQRVRGWVTPGPRRRADQPASGDCAVSRMTVVPHAWRALRAWARSRGVTPFAVVAAAALPRLTPLAGGGGHYAVTVADRDAPEIAESAGYQITTIPCPPLRAASEVDRVRQVGQGVRAAMAAARVPLPTLMAELGTRSIREIAPLVLAWDVAYPEALKPLDAKVRTLTVAPLGLRWPMALLLSDGDGLSATLEYDAEAVDAATADAAMVEFVDALLAMAGVPA